MDPLTSFALVGTSRRNEPDGDCGSPAGAVLSKLDGVPIETRVLLAAGARAVASMAGRRAITSDEVVVPCPAETVPECSSGAARLVDTLLRGHHAEVLPEALRLLARARRRLPHPLLPLALRVRDDEVRALMRPVVGARGAWLSAMNESWRWVAEVPTAARIEDLEAAWTDGTAQARRELLSRARTLDAAVARGWLEATWSNEKADERAALLSTLRVGVSAADEPFVEAQLRDRASSVREAAQTLLPYLSESAFVSRMTARADAMLDFRKSALSFVGKRGTLVVNPPEKVDDAAERDGLAKPPQGVGARAFWLTRAVAAVPLAHWPQRFGAKPTELVAAAEATDWASAVCEGWTTAAIVHGDGEWLGALVDFFQRADEKTVSPPIARAKTIAILRRMTPDDAATRVEALFDAGQFAEALALALHAIPSPWSVGVGMRWIERLRRDLDGAPASSAIFGTVSIAALALPGGCLPAALALREVAEAIELSTRSPFADFFETVLLRHDLIQEISP